ncbi:hypothetical protein HAX54_017606 [Datura stramonium]|uniref:DNA-directed RNA polymerase n=1 Tax=Datura stramonium TaxID=4076 RepID=A0ABS8S106_DATST|nr:hypothetical protein [Datura stramonium]
MQKQSHRQNYNNIHLFIIIFLTVVVGLPLSSYSRHDDYSLEKYAVIFDAGSTGNRVHVFHFNPNMDLLNIELFLAVQDPRAAANSLKPLLEKAEAVVPKNLQSQIPVKVGATAGLRLLKGDSSEKILQALDAPCNHKNCSFAGVWNGGGGPGTKNLHVSSFSYDFACEIDGGKLMSSDINELYRRVIYRNNTLTDLLRTSRSMPGELVMCQEKLVQETVDTLLDNGTRGQPMRDNHNKVYKSFSDVIEGKVRER